MKEKMRGGGAAGQRAAWCLLVCVSMLLRTSIALAQDPDLERPATESSQPGDTTTALGGGAYLDLAYALSNNRPANHEWRSKSTTPTVDRVALNNATVWLKKRSSSSSRWGFGAGLQVGKDVDKLATSDSETADLLKHLHYTYATYRAPVGGQELALVGGLIPGHLGYESFQAMDNPTYTRVYGVDNVPYFQWGLAAQYPYGGKVSGAVMVTTGWDYLSSPNNAPSYGGRLHWDVSDSAWLRGNVFYGPEQENTALEFWRLAVEGIGQVRFGDFELIGNLGYGAEKQATVIGSPRYQWSWGALWVNWQPGGGPWSAGLRPEFFRDEEALITSSRQTITAVTAALRYRVTVGKQVLQIRTEYRFDRSTGLDGGFWEGPNNVLVPNQQLFMLAVNWRFETPRRGGS